MPQRKQHVVAVDTNILLDLALPRDHVHDAIDLMRKRISNCIFWALPTVLEELQDISESDGHKPEERRQAEVAFAKMVGEWKIIPANCPPVGHGVEEQIADNIRRQGLLPEAERNDSLIVAESAMANCQMILTSDSHLLGISASRLQVLLREHDVGSPLIVSPRKILAEFAVKRKRT